MNPHLKKNILPVLLSLILFPALAQTSTFKSEFSKLYDFNLVPKVNNSYNEFYEISIPQIADHSNATSKFNQRIYLGFQDFTAPTVIVTDGYAIDYVSKPDYSNELAKELHANIVIVEHRFFGKSAPDTADLKLLSIRQAADDYHYIKSLLGKIFPGKWLATGISKGGQAALSYKMFYPDDVSAVVAYGAAIKNKQTIFADTLLSGLSLSPCGKKITELQSYLFKHKTALLPYFSDITAQKNFDYTPLDNETVFDYLLLELPFSFWQNGNKCDDIPDTTVSFENHVSYLTKIVPPRLFSKSNKGRLEPAFYMFYHELGYYEYNISPFIKYLKQKDYSSKLFTPQNITIPFDDSFQKAVSTFMKSKSSKNVFLIYGQNDPWALQTSTDKNIFIVPSGSHKSRIADLPSNLKADIYKKLRKALK